jgi:hypothetical protein
MKWIDGTESLSQDLSRRLGEKTRATLATVVAVAALLTQPAQAAEALRWKFTKGETLKYTMEQKTVQEMKAMEREVKTTTNQTVDFHWTVKNVVGGIAEMSQTIDRVRIKFEAPGSTFEFDSQSGKNPEGPVAGMLTPMLKALVGAEFLFKMNGRGEPTDIQVPKQLQESLSKAGPAMPAGGMSSEEGLRNQISQLSLALPEKGLERGGTWNQQLKVPMPMLGTMLINKTYTYQGPHAQDPNQIKIGLNTKFALEPAADSNIAAVLKGQKGDGEFSFDNQAGRVRSSHVNDHMVMSITVQGQTLEQTVDTVTSMALADAAASR